MIDTIKIIFFSIDYLVLFNVILYSVNDLIKELKNNK